MNEEISMSILALNSYAAGKWVAPSGRKTQLRSAIDGRVVAELGAEANRQADNVDIKILGLFHQVGADVDVVQAGDRHGGILLAAPGSCHRGAPGLRFKQ